jgi:hypothetical protein
MTIIYYIAGTLISWLAIAFLILVVFSGLGKLNQKYDIMMSDYFKSRKNNKDV